MTAIKICGISDVSTLAQVCELPIDYIGFVCHPGSPRHVDLPLLTELVSAMPAHIKSVIVLVNPNDAFLEQLFAACTPDYLQLHGGEEPERITQIKASYNTRVIKSVAVAEASDIQIAHDYVDVADMIIFDTKTTGGSGGTGKSFDWSLLSNFVIPSAAEESRDNCGDPSASLCSAQDDSWMLSGGLSAQNIAEALNITNAPMVDASSHLETPPKSGQKDIEKIKEFVKRLS